MSDISPIEEGIQVNPLEEKFDVEIPTLKSLYIEIRFGETRLSSGTAFLVANDRDTHCALITNRHNVTGRHQITGECLSSHGGIPDNIIIYFHTNDERIGLWKAVTLPLYRVDGTPYWIEHPVLGPKADLVALNLTWGSDISKFPYFLKNRLDRIEMVLGPADTVSVIGFPFGLSSVRRFPLWSTGFLAQELTLVTPEYPVFFIDCRTRQGQSGSAVIAYRAAGYRQVKDGKVVAHLSPDKVWEFLGIYSGRINAESDLGMVWHVSAIQEVLDAAARDNEMRVAAHAKRLEKTDLPLDDPN